jgi:hypothetical protein
MAENEILEEYSQRLNPESSHAKLLVKLSPSGNTLEAATRIIEASGANIIGLEPLSSNLVLIRLDTADMRGIALKLIEKGFTHLKGVNALPEQKHSGDRRSGPGVP